MQRAKNISAFGQIENGNRMTKHMSLKLPSTGNPEGGSAAIGGGGLKHHNTVTGAAMKRRNKVGQISSSTRERWRQTTRNIKVRH